MKLLDRYLFKEMIFPFLYGFLIILILVWGNIIFSYLNLIVARIHEWYLVLNFLLCKLPSCILISLAAGAIFGVSIGINRISKDSELVALKSGGISTKRIFISILLFGLIISVIGYIFQELIIIKAENKGEKILDILYQIPGDLPIEPDIFVKSNSYSVYIGSIERTKEEIKYNNIELYKLINNYPKIITAEYALERDGFWLLVNGYINDFDNNGKPKIISRFKTLKINISSDVLSKITNPIKSPNTLSSLQLIKKIQSHKKLGISTQKLELELNYKLAFPLSAFIILYSLIPICLIFPMKNSSIGMIFGIIIFFIYWNIMWFSKILGETGGISPFLAGWSIIIIFGIVGSVLTFILFKYH